MGFLQIVNIALEMGYNIIFFSVDMEKAVACKNGRKLCSYFLSLKRWKTRPLQNWRRSWALIHLSLTRENQRLQNGVAQKTLGLTLGREEQPALVRKIRARSGANGENEARICV